MRKTAAVGVVAVGMFGLTQARAADDYRAEALLHWALPATADVEIDDLNWHCAADKCAATAVVGVRSGSRLDQCKKLAAALGKVASFSSQGKEMSKRDLDSCNRVAR